MSEKQQRALTIIRNNGPLNGNQFAALMWPESPGWSKSSKAGNYGSRFGAGMWRAGGSYLAKLYRKGLLYRYDDSLRHPGHSPRYELSPVGIKALGLLP